VGTLWAHSLTPALISGLCRIERPVVEAVPLFWRFMIEKYGVAPHRG
jgi:hypothetical protein